MLGTLKIAGRSGAKEPRHRTLTSGFEGKRGAVYLLFISRFHSFFRIIII